MTSNDLIELIFYFFYFIKILHSLALIRSVSNYLMKGGATAPSKGWPELDVVVLPLDSGGCLLKLDQSTSPPHGGEVLPIFGFFYDDSLSMIVSSPGLTPSLNKSTSWYWLGQWAIIWWRGGTTASSKGWPELNAIVPLPSHLVTCWY